MLVSGGQLGKSSRAGSTNSNTSDALLHLPETPDPGYSWTAASIFELKSRSTGFLFFPFIAFGEDLDFWHPQQLSNEFHHLIHTMHESTTLCFWPDAWYPPSMYSSFLKGQRTTSRSHKPLLNYKQSRSKALHFQKTGKDSLWPELPSLSWVTAKCNQATTNTHVPELENPEQSSWAQTPPAPRKSAYPSGQCHSQDLNLRPTKTYRPPLNSPWNKLLLFTSETVFWFVVWGFFSYKASGKTGIMKNRCIPKTLPASLEIKREKKKKKFNKAVAERKCTLP